MKRAVAELQALGKGNLLDDDRYLHPKKTSRAWMNDFSALHGLRIMRGREIELLRAHSCRKNAILAFFLRHQRLLKKDPALLFNADETMISAKKIAKCVVPSHFKQGLCKENLSKTHISAMMCFSASGAKVSPFLILPALKNLPRELSFVAQYECTIVSSANGWMTRTLF
jgi:hypothetical protein